MARLPTQLPLFPEENSPQENISESAKAVSWSYSRRTLFEQCARRYYYNYFGGKKRTAKSEGNKDQIRFLSTLKAGHLRVGDIAHRAIRNYFKWEKEGKESDLKDLARRGLRNLNEDRVFSRNYIEGVTEPNKSVLLLEYFYQWSDVEEFYDELANKLTHSLENFTSSPSYEEFRWHGRSPSALVEHDIDIKDLSYKVEGKIDLAYLSEDKVVIVDWKLGFEDNFGEDSLQLAVYGLWIQKHFKRPIEDLQIYKAYLGSGTAKAFTISPRILSNAKARIAQDVERLALMNQYGNEANIDAFTPCFHEAICKSCPFWRLCYD